MPAWAIDHVDGAHRLGTAVRARQTDHRLVVQRRLVAVGGEVEHVRHRLEHERPGGAQPRLGLGDRQLRLRAARAAATSDVNGFFSVARAMNASSAARATPVATPTLLNASRLYGGMRNSAVSTRMPMP